MNNRGKRKNNMSDTGKIPLSQLERELIEEKKRENREKIIIRQDESTNRETKTQAKKKNGCSGIMLSIIIIFTFVSASLLGILYYFSSEMQYNKAETDLDNIINSIESTSDGLYNLLLIGTDQSEEGKSRSDTMILLTIDSNNEKIKLTSFMRDLWVKIPENDSGRLNSAFTLGGASLLTETISENFDIIIDNYMLVDFEMFEKLIDSFGGIDVEITEKEASFINRTTHAKVTSGLNSLNGDYALIYCRIRKLDSDFMRTQRQRKVINAIIDKAKSQSIITTADAVTDILPLIQTDINPMKMTFLIIKNVNKINYQITQCRIPFDDTYSNERINGQAVLVPDIEANRKLLKSFISE